VAEAAAAAAAVAVAAAADPITLVVRRTRADAWSLRAPDPLLDGNIPLRAARACVPFLEANGAGLWVAPPRTLTVERANRSVRCSDPTVSVQESRGVVTLRVDTGLLLELPEGATLAVDRAHNRSDWRVSVAPQRLASGAPLSLALSLPSSAIERGPAHLDGPLASLLVLPALARWASANETESRAMLERHQAFFDRAYFDRKRSGPTQQYRDRRRDAPRSLIDGREADAIAFAMHGGVALDGDALSLRAECGFSAEHYGASTRCTADPTAMQSRASAIVRALQALDPSIDPEDPAVLYLRNPIVAHTQGDPHALVKPALFAATRAGWSLVIDGGPAFVLRGVVDATWFHAVPVVVVVRESLHVAAGAPLARVRAVPDSMLRPSLQWE
jgi:hypothetical protein